MSPRKKQQPEIEEFKQARAELIARRKSDLAEIKAYDKKIATLQAKFKNPVLKGRIINFLRPIMGDRGWTYDEMLKAVEESDQIPHLELETAFKTSITSSVKRFKTLEIREDGLYYLRKKK